MRVVLLTFLILGVLASPAQADLKRFVKDGGGDWNNPDNWIGGVPGPTDTARLEASGTVTLSLPATVANVDSAGSHLKVDGVTLTIAGSGDGSLANAEVVNGGIVAITGSSGLGGPLTLGSGLTSAGTIVVSGVARLTGGEIREAAAGLGTVSIDSTGELRVEPFSSGEIAATFDNQGIVKADGTLIVTPTKDSPVSDGDYAIGATFSLRPPADSTFTITGSLTGAGTFEVGPPVTGTPGIVRTAGTFTPGRLLITAAGNRSGRLELAAPGTVRELDGAGIRAGTAALSVTGPASSDLAGLQLLGGATTFAGPVTIANAQGIRALAVGAGASAKLTGTTSLGPGELNLTGPLENAGALTVTSGASLLGDGGLKSSGTLSLPSGMFFGDGRVENTGTVSVDGRFNFGGPFVQTAGLTTVTGTLDKAVTLKGGILRGTGTVTSVDNQGGTVEPGASPGILHVSGAYSQGAGGTLRMDVTGRTAGSQLDQLATGSATLDGALAVVGDAAFFPQPNDRLPIVTGTTSGRFTSVTGNAVDSRHYSPDYSASGVELCVVATAVTCDGAPDADYDGIPDDEEPVVTPTPTPTPTPTETPTATVLPATPTPAAINAPTAQFISATSPTLGHATWLNGASSTAVEGQRIVKYQWDFDGNGRIDGECGPETPAVSHPYKKAGSYTPQLTVTDSLGQVSVVTKQITVPTSDVNTGRLQVYDCEQPLGGNQADRPGCVKTFAYGIVEVNSRGTSDQCFEIEGRPRELVRCAGGPTCGPGKHVIKTPLRDVVWYHAKIAGPVALNGLPIRVPDGVKTEYDSGDYSIGIGTLPIELPVPGGGTVKVADVPLTKKLDPKPNAEYPGFAGVEKLFSTKIKGGPKGWGGLKRQAEVELTLLPHASEAKLSVSLPDAFSFPAFERSVQAWVRVRATNVGGFDFSGARIGPLDRVFLGPLIVRNLQFTYKKGLDGGPDSWSGGADFQFLEAGPIIRASPPPPDYGFGLLGGAFDHAGGGVRFETDPRPQIFPGVELLEIGGAIGTKPLRFTGRLSIAAGKVIAIDSTAFIALASKQQPYTFPSEFAPPGLEDLSGGVLDSFSVAIGGNASLTVPKLGSLPLVRAFVFYAYPDYFKFGGKFELKPFEKFGEEADRFKVKGEMKGFLDAGNGLFNTELGGEVCVDIELLDLCQGVNMLVSSKGIAACVKAIIPVPPPFGVPVPVNAGIGYKWGDAWPPDVMLFTCDVGDYREASVRSAQAGTHTFTLPDGLPAARVKIAGAGGVPQVKVDGPGGGAGERFFTLPIKETNTLMVYLDHPRGGTWTVTAQPVSPVLASVAVGEGLAAPKVRARVTGHTLRYSGTAREKVTFAERGPRTFNVLGAARGANGSLRFTPAAGPSGTRDIVALVERGGVIRYQLPVARYKAVGTGRLARPRGLKVRHRGSAVTLRWRRVPGAATYAVTVQAGIGPPLLRITRKPGLTLRGIARRTTGTVRIAAVARDSSPGREARARLRRAR